MRNQELVTNLGLLVISSVRRNLLMQVEIFPSLCLIEMNKQLLAFVFYAELDVEPVEPAKY